MRRFLALASVIILTATGCSVEGNPELESYSKNGACSIDVPVNGASLPADQPFEMGGWAFDQMNMAVPPVITVYFVNTKTGNTVAVSAKRGTKREDVAQAYGNPLLGDAGFDASIEAGKLAPGSYRVLVIQVNRQASPISCGDEYTISLN